jgi:DNA-binding NarL/FixJ family response regulator
MRILIAEDHEVVRHGIRTVLEARPQWEVCGEAFNGHQALRMAGELLPDIIIMDITMPVMTGLEAAEQVTKYSPDTKVLIFTMHESQTLLEIVRRIGARGYLVKSRAGDDLITALECLDGGGTFFPPAAQNPN